MAAELRWRTTPLADARRELLNACDRALATPSLSEAKRLELARLRTTQAALLAMPAAPLGKVAPVAADPLDGPRELKEKADFLRDSEDKLKREVHRLSSRIDDVERRRHLRERVGAVDDDMFGEAASNRKFARLSSTAASQNAKTSDSNPSASLGGGMAATPTVGGVSGTTPNSNNNFGNTPAPATPGGERSSDTAVLRNLVDPSTLDELRRADGGDDLDRQVRALKKAQGELEGMAAELERRAKSLSTRADELKRQK